jgi:hypothetical protein
VTTTTTAAPPPPPPTAELGKCLVCGEPIQPGNLVGCTKCDTPHHRDCFEYNGHCAVYACGSTTYSVKWRKGKPQVMRAGKGPAEPERQEPLRPIVPPPRRERQQEALGENEIRIESYGALRTLGIGFGAAAGSLFATCGAPAADSTACSGCDAGTADFSAGGLEGLLAGIFALIAIWLFVAFVMPALFSAVGWLLYWFDNSYWTVDERGRLVLKTRFFGIPVWTRKWPVSRAEEVCVGPVRGSQVQWLVVRFLGGGQVFLADDRRHERMGYDGADLVRMGRRLASALHCSFRTVGEHAERPYEPAE